MEQLGAFFEGEWASFSELYTTNEESEFMTLLGDFLPASELGGECLGVLGVQSDFWPFQTSANVASIVDDDSFVYSSDPSISNVSFSPQETSTYSGSDGDGDITNFLLSSSQGTCNKLGDSNRSFAANDFPSYFNSVDFSFEEEQMSSAGNVCSDQLMQLDEGSNHLKNISKFDAENPSNAVAFHDNKGDIQVLDYMVEGKVTCSPAVSKKRQHTAEAQNQKNKRNVKPKKSKKVAEIMNIDEDKSDCDGLITQTSSTKCLKNDSTSAPSETNGDEISNLTTKGNGKARANRGSATDPQSLYARKRREKINERLRILQGLVPNGTKVDISTMLDEAVQYVKFLQLQIKLLSSDDMWMYAPLAYNGMDLGLDLKI